MLTIREEEAKPDDGMVEFGTLEKKSPFVWEGCMYLVLECAPAIGSIVCNALDVKNCMTLKFPLDMRVLPVEGELVWRRKK